MRCLRLYFVLLVLFGLASLTGFAQESPNPQTATGPTRPNTPTIVAKISLSGQIADVRTDRRFPHATLFTPKKDGFYQISTYPMMKGIQIPDGCRNMGGEFNVFWTDAPSSVQEYDISLGVDMTGYWRTLSLPVFHSTWTIHATAGAPISYQIGVFSNSQNPPECLDSKIEYNLFIVVQRFFNDF